MADGGSRGYIERAVTHILSAIRLRNSGYCHVLGGWTANMYEPRINIVSQRWAGCFRTNVQKTAEMALSKTKRVRSEWVSAVPGKNENVLHILGLDRSSYHSVGETKALMRTK